MTFDPRPFPLEIFNEKPTPKKVLDAEVPVTADLEPDAGWQVWQRPDHQYPVTTLLALEAVQAVKEQGARQSECLDHALRTALFAHSRTVSMRHEILDIASGCDDVSVEHLAQALDDGRARSTIMACKEQAAAGEVRGSPHLFLPDGTDSHNPGIDMEWTGHHGLSFPVVASDQPEIYEGLLTRAAGEGKERHG